MYLRKILDIESIDAAGQVSITTGMQIFQGKVGCFGKVLDGVYSCVSITDNGKGIESGDLMRIFEPFFSKKKMGRSGTGLGMTVVWGAVNDHDGHIEIDSSPGMGTRITLYYPGTAEKVSCEEDIDIKNFMGNREKILVVDDTETQQAITSAMLESLGYRVETATEIDEAVESVKKWRIDLVILDMILGKEGDGLDLFMRLIDIDPGIRVIITSGFSENDRVRKAQQLGAREYIKKPYTLDRIAVTVKKALSYPPVSRDADDSHNQKPTQV